MNDVKITSRLRKTTKTNEMKKVQYDVHARRQKNNTDI